MYAWVYIVFAVIVGFIMYSFHKSFSYFTYYQSQFINMYITQEEQELNDQMKQKTREMSIGCVKNFLREKRAKREWDILSLLKARVCELCMLRWFTSYQ